jgi:hypothetical protein
MDIYAPDGTKVENTDTGVVDNSPGGTGKIGKISFASQQNANLDPGMTRNFTATYKFDKSVTAYTYTSGNYTYKYIAWANNYPGSGTDAISIGPLQSWPLTITIPKPSYTFSSYSPEDDDTYSEIMKGGKAYRWYRLLDDHGDPILNETVRYKYYGASKIFVATTDDKGGFIKIETDWLLDSAILILEVLNDDNSVKTDVNFAPTFFVNVIDREFSQEWSLLFGIKGIVDVGGPSLRLGPLKFHTVEAGIEGGRSSRTILTYDIKGNQNTVTLSNEIDNSAEASVSAGIFGQAWGSAKRPQIEIGATAGVKGRLRNGASFKFPNFMDASKHDQDKMVLAAAGFFLETAITSLVQMPVGLDSILNWLIDKMTSLEDYQEGLVSETGYGMFGNLKASFTLTNPLGAMPGSTLGISLFNFDEEIFFSQGTELKKDGVLTSSYSVTAAIDSSPLKLSFSQKFGGDKRREDIPKFNVDCLFPLTHLEGEESIRVEKMNGDLNRFSISKNSSKTGTEFSLYTETSTWTTAFSVTDKSTIANMKAKSDYLKSIIDGQPNINIVPTMFNDAYQIVLESAFVPQEWTVEREDARLTKIPFDIELPSPVPGLSLGLGIDIEGMQSRRFTEKKGTFTSDRILDLEEYQTDDIMETNRRSLGDFLNVFKEAITSAILGMVNTTFNAVNEGVEQVGASIRGSLEGVTGFLSKIIPVQKTYRVLAVPFDLKEISVASHDVAYTAGTIGDVYVVNLRDKNGNEITDFSSSPITLKMAYADDMLAASGYDISKASRMSIYRWDGSIGFYIYQKSIVDTVNKTVTADITKAGQYILAIDEVIPVITGFNVSDKTPTATISASIVDAFSGIDVSSFVFKLDGEVKVNSLNLLDYYDVKSGIFKYIVPAPLAEGNHTAEIKVKDSAGNLAAAPVLPFVVNNAPPTIFHVAVTSAASGGDLAIGASIRDDTGVKRGLLFYKPDSDRFQFSYLEMTKGWGDDFVGVIPREFVTSLGLKYYISAEDIDGNIYAMPNSVTVTISDKIGPSKPTGLSAIALDKSLFIRWSSVPDIDAIGYRMFYGQSAGYLDKSIDVGPFTSFGIKGLENGKTYYIAVLAYDAAGNQGQISDVISGRPEDQYAPKIIPNPSFINGLSVNAQKSSAQQSITLSNMGNSNLVVNALALAGSGASDFKLSNDYCSGRTVAPFASCSVEVAFSAVSAGEKRADLSVNSNDPERPILNIPMNGTAYYVLSVSLNPPGAGTVKGGSIDCPGSCSENVTANGTSIELMVSANLGFTFSNWSQDLTGSADRASVFMDGNKNVVANFTSVCNLPISPAIREHGCDAGTGEVSVTAGPNCCWTASTNPDIWDWVSISSGSSGCGNGAVTYKVLSNNSGKMRTGTLTIAGQTFNIRQRPVECSSTIYPSSEAFWNDGGSASVYVTAGPGCAWTASTDPGSWDWIGISSGSSGTGSGTVKYLLTPI